MDRLESVRTTLTNEQFDQLKLCVRNVRLGDSLLCPVKVAGSALFFFDYVLTFRDEARFLRRSKKTSLGTGPFIISRYCALLIAILSLTPFRNEAIVDTVSTVLRLISIIASEFIVAVRTWALWGRNRKVFYILTCLTIAAVIPGAIVIGLGVATNKVRPLVIPELIKICSTTMSDLKNAFLVPYILTIIYNSSTLALSLYRVTMWRRSIPEDVRAPLLDTLWRDGVLYFICMLLMNFMNIGIVIQSEVPQLRSPGGNLQAIMQSIVAVRLVLHLAISSNPRDITDSAISAYNSTTTGTDIQFSTRLSMQDTVDRLPISRRDAHHEEQ